MAVCLEKIERLEVGWDRDSDTPWKDHSFSRKWRKKEMNRFLRRHNRQIEPDEVEFKRGRKPYKGWEY